jgi:hypothetical protein
MRQRDGIQIGSAGDATRSQRYDGAPVSSPSGARLATPSGAPVIDDLRLALTLSCC